MINRLSDEAVEFGDALTERIRSAGGVDLMRAAVRDPALRGTRVAALLEETGVWDLDLDDPMEREAAAAAVRAAGCFGLPYPVCERLAQAQPGAAAMLISRDRRVLASHADLPLDWQAYDVAGKRYRISVDGPLLGTRLGPFASELTVAEEPGGDIRTAALLGTLQNWWLLGLLETVLAHTIQYTKEREQFGRPLTKFQTVGFRLADMSVQVHALEELAKYTLWSVGRADASDGVLLVDSLSLRAGAQYAAQVVLRGAHQLHGAMGFTDDVDISWLSRASQAPRRLPLGDSQTLAALADAIEYTGYAGVVSGPQDHPRRVERTA